MSTNNFDTCVALTFKYEGGYTNNPSDPGGPTNWGITIADAKKYWKPDATAADVKTMPKSVAYSIYKQKYWVTTYYDCDKLDAGVDFAIFDFGVNSGPARAKKILMASVGGTPEETVNKICDARMAFLKQLKTWPVFGKGWTSRVEDVRTKAIAMTKKSQAGTVAGGAVVIGGATAASQAPHHLIPWIIGGSIVAGIVIWLVYEYIQFRKTKNV